LAAPKPRLLTCLYHHDRRPWASAYHRQPDHPLQPEGAIDYSLTDRGTGARLAGGRVHSFTAYSATGSTVAGLAAEEDAAYRLMRILADQVVARLIATAASLP
jgi:hypothetical protein